MAGIDEVVEMPVVAALAESGCELRGDAATQAVDQRVKAATEQDWRTEYLEAIIAVRGYCRVSGLMPAVPAA